MPATTARVSPFKKYWQDLFLGIKTTYIGMTITMREYFQPPTTLLYPEVRPIVPPGHRGIHGYDEPLCISCDMCANACPVSCIYIKSVGRGKDALMTQFDIDYTKCLFCDLCTPPCPTECIWMTEEFDLASYSKADCIMNFARLKTPEEIAAHEEKLKKKEEEKKAKAAAKKPAEPKAGAKPEAAAAEGGVAVAEAEEKKEDTK